MPYDITELKGIKIEIIRKLPTMATTSETVDYSFSNDEKLIINNQNYKIKLFEESEAGPSSEINRAPSVDSVPDNQGQSRRSADIGTSEEKKSINVNEAITKPEIIRKNLKKQRDISPEDKRIIRDVSKKRSRKKRYSSSLSSNDSSSERPERSPSPKRTKKEPPRKKYDSDSSTNKEQRYRLRENSLSSLNSDRSYSCVSRKLKKELSSFLGNSFVSINSKRNKHARKSKRDRSRSESNTRYSRRDSYDRARYSRKDYSRDSRTRRDDSHDRYSKKKSTRRNTDRYNNDYQQVRANEIEERYSRYYAVMYAFSIIMDILRQDDIYSTY